VIRQQDKMGTIETGKMANLLILARDPLSDISNLRSTVFTIKRGRRFDRSDYRPIRPEEVEQHD
jgi:imidazolonepropionase-like amidohydrolase